MTWQQGASWPQAPRGQRGPPGETHEVSYFSGVLSASGPLPDTGSGTRWRNSSPGMPGAGSTADTAMTWHSRTPIATRHHGTSCPRRRPTARVMSPKESPGRGSIPQGACPGSPGPVRRGLRLELHGAAVHDARGGAAGHEAGEHRREKQLPQCCGARRKRGHGMKPFRGPPVLHTIGMDGPQASRPLEKKDAWPNAQRGWWLECTRDAAPRPG